VARAARAYRTMSVTTVRPVDLIERLTRRALDLARAAAESAGDRTNEARRYSQRCQDIVVELLGSLNHEVGQIATNLAELYLFTLARLREGDRSRQRRPYEEAAAVLVPLSDAWTAVTRNQLPRAVSA